MMLGFDSGTISAVLRMNSELFATLSGSKHKSFDDNCLGTDKRGSPTTAQDWGLSRNVSVLIVSFINSLVAAMCVVVTVSYMCCVLWISVFELSPLCNK